MKWFVIPIVCMLVGSALAHEPSKPTNVLDRKPLSVPKDWTSLHIRLVDDQSGLSLPGCIRIRAENASEDNFVPLVSLLPRGLGLSKQRQRGWYVVANGEAIIKAPDSDLQIEAISGIEYEHKSVKTSKRSVEIRLKRLFDPSADHWIAGNTHLHLMKLSRETADRYLTDVPRADGLSIVFVSYLERALVDSQYISNRYTEDDLRRLSNPSLILGSGEEYRHNIGGGGEGYGHVLLLNHPHRILPASIGPGITNEGTDGIPLSRGIDRARDDGGTAIWCHNAFGFEDMPSWLSGRLDAQNIFDGGNSGTYEDTYYRYLNLGLRVPFSTGTDWFIYDFSRVYARLSEDQELSIASWIQALRAGRSIITNGPWLELNVDDSQIGDTIKLAKPSVLRVTAQATGRHEFAAIEVVFNGKVVQNAPADQGTAQIAVDLPVDRTGWIAVRIKADKHTTNEMRESLFAHSSPIYITVGKHPIRVPGAAESAIRELERSIGEITANGVFSGLKEKAEILKIYRDAVGQIRQLQ